MISIGTQEPCFPFLDYPSIIPGEGLPLEADHGGRRQVSQGLMRALEGTKTPAR